MRNHFVHHHGILYKLVWEDVGEVLSNASEHVKIRCIRSLSQISISLEGNSEIVSKKS